MKPARAFTVVELLVVMSIIILLIALLLPALSKARSAMRASICLNNVTQIHAAHVAHSNDYDGRFMPSVNPDGQWWTTSLLEYHTANDVLFCPETTIKATPTLGTLGFGGPDATWFDGIQWPSDPLDVSSYGQNMWVNNPTESRTLWGHEPELHWYHPLLAPDATNIPVVTDAMWVGGFPYSHDVPAAAQWDQTIGGGHQTNRFALDRHDGAVEVAFIDGSARRVALPDLWTLRWNHDYTPREIALPWYVE